MTVTVTINFPDAQPAPSEIQITDAAMRRARLSFNPSGDPRVNRLKALAAAFYSELEDLARDPIAGREAATAMTQIQGGAMFAVSAATAHLA